MHSLPVITLSFHNFLFVGTYEIFLDESPLPESLLVQRKQFNRVKNKGSWATIKPVSLHLSF